MGKVIILLFAIGIVFYLLYRNGYLVAQNKRALLYIGSLKGNKARFTSCTGRTRRVIRFKKDGICRLDFEPELTRGEVWVEILDSAKQQILCLDSHTRSGDLSVEKGKRYYLVVHFKSATGSYSLNWDEREINGGQTE